MTSRNRLADALPSIVLLCIAAFYLWASLEYNAESRAMPFGVAVLAIALVVLDLLSRGGGAFGRILRRVLQGGAPPAAAIPGLEGQAGKRHGPMQELAAFGWIVGFLLLAIVVGFYIAIPLYVIAYLRFFAGKSIVKSAAMGLGLAAVLFAMFELMLGYNVFGGLISGDFM